jgi:hypothetical protein
MTRRDFVATTGIGCLLASAVPRRDLERLKVCARWARPERMRQPGFGGMSARLGPPLIVVFGGVTETGPHAL